MKRHTQTYFDLNPKPSAKRALYSGLLYLCYTLYGALVVYFLTVFMLAM